VSHRLEHRVARLERLVGARPRLLSVAELLATEEADEPPPGWWASAMPRIGPALGCPPELASRELRAIVQRTWADRHIVARAILRRLEEWAGLDEARRARAVEEEKLAQLAAEVRRVGAAADAHGLPVSAPDLSPPITWSLRRIDQRLQCFVTLGRVKDTGERRAGWPVYAEPAAGDGAVEPVAGPEEAAAPE
jgi:hypothetical protein